MPTLLTIIAVGFFILTGLALVPQVSERPALQAMGYFLAGIALIVIGYGGR
jgi:hypothetical protein